MIELTHYDDGKKNFQSHEVSIKEKCFYNAKYDVTSHNIFDLIGYGETKEEALEDYQKNMDTPIYDVTNEEEEGWLTKED